MKELKSLVKIKHNWVLLQCKSLIIINQLKSRRKAKTDCCAHLEWIWSTTIQQNPVLLLQAWMVDPSQG